MQVITSFLNRCKELRPIIIALKQQGAISYLVGGSVRDLVLRVPVKDLDIEVHGVVPDVLERVLKKFAPVSLVGKKFGVYKLAHMDVDWSLPRKDSMGRKPEVVIDTSMTIEDACRRRDVTMNAMAINLNDLIDNFSSNEEELTSTPTDVGVQDMHDSSVGESIQTIDSDLGDTCNSSVRESVQATDSDLGDKRNLSVQESIPPTGGMPPIIDLFNGLADIKAKILRAVDEKTFVEDPLRFYRVMQFISRFEMLPDTKLETLCTQMSLIDPILQKPIARERIFEELKKLCLKSNRPSLGFRWLAKIGRLKELFPELYATLEVPQREDYHPEGDVFEHSMQAFDASAQLDEFIERALDENDVDRAPSIHPPSPKASADAKAMADTSSDTPAAARPDPSLRSGGPSSDTNSKGPVLSDELCSSYRRIEGYELWRARQDERPNQSEYCIHPDQSLKDGGKHNQEKTSKKTPLILSATGGGVSKERGVPWDSNSSRKDKIKLTIMLAVLCHDLGKPEVTVKGEDGLLHAWDHEIKGVPIAKRMLKRITDTTFLIKAVSKLVRHHMAPGILLRENATLKAYKRLAIKCAPEVTLWQLGLVALCDLRGRNPKGHDPLPIDSQVLQVLELFTQKIKEARVEHKPEEPVLLGRDLLEYVEPGPQLGNIVKAAYEIQLEEGVKDLEELKKRIIEKFGLKVLNA